MPLHRSAARRATAGICLAIQAFFFYSSSSLLKFVSVLQYSVELSRASNSACRSSSRRSVPGTSRLRSSSTSRAKAAEACSGHPGVVILCLRRVKKSSPNVRAKSGAGQTYGRRALETAARAVGRVGRPPAARETQTVLRRD